MVIGIPKHYEQDLDLLLTGILDHVYENVVETQDILYYADYTHLRASILESAIELLKNTRWVVAEPHEAREIDAVFYEHQDRMEKSLKEELEVLLDKYNKNKKTLAEQEKQIESMKELVCSMPAEAESA